MPLNQAIKIYADRITAEQKSSATIKGYHGALMLFCLYLRNPLIQLVTVDQVDLYFKERFELGWKRNSAVVPAMALRKFFEYWRRKGYPVLDYQLLPIIHKESVEPRVASSDALERMLAECAGSSLYDVRNRAIVLMFADTGARNGELCSIDFDAIEKREVVEENGVRQYSCVIRSEKRRGSHSSHRRIFWYDDAQAALDEWLSARTRYVLLFPPRHPEALFISVKDSHGKMGSRMTPFSVGLMLRDLSVRAGIPTINAHSLRHKFGNDAAENGLNNSNISDLMGHATLASSFVYTHLKGKQLGRAHRKMKHVRESEAQ